MRKTETMRVLRFICYVLLIIPHMKPAYITENMPLLERLFDVARAASFYLIAIRLFVVRHRISRTVFLIIGLEVYPILITILRNGQVYNQLLTAFSILSIVFLYDSVDDNPDIFLSALLFCFEIMVYINLMTIIMYPGGIYTSGLGTLFVSNHNYFLGHYNNLDKYFIPALVTAWLYAELTGKRIRAFIMMAAVYISTLLTWSGGMLLSLFAMLVAFVYIETGKQTLRFLNYEMCWLIHPVFFVAIILLKLQTNFRWLIDGILHKWPSLLSRMELWNRAISLIADHPILGHGVLSQLERERENGFHFAMHMHNMLLEILYQGGFVYLFLFIAFVIIVGSELRAYRNTKVAQIITLGFLGWCIHTTVEPFMTAFLMGMFILADKCDLFISAAEEAQKRKRIRRRE